MGKLRGLQSGRWKKVEIGDELLAGSTEGGFLELEELECNDATFLDLGKYIGAAATPVAEDEEDNCVFRKGGEAATSAKLKRRKARKAEAGISVKDRSNATSREGVVPDTSDRELREANEVLHSPDVKPTKKKKQKKRKCADEDEDNTVPATGLQGSDTLQDLRKQVAQLQAENAMLKRTKGVHDSRLLSSSKAKKKSKKQRCGIATARSARQAQDAEEAASLATIGELDTQEEPKTNVLAWERFALAPSIMRGLSQLGFERPTPIQEACLIPAMRDRRDIIGAAQTGSGKTLAFGLPILQCLLEERESQGAVDSGECKTGAPRSVRALILTPTRELALQVCNHLQALAKGCGIWVQPLVGGLAVPKQERLLRKGPEVIVATPGRLWEGLRCNWPGVSDVRRLSWLVLDEADRMVQQGHYQELTSIFAYIDGERSKYGASLVTQYPGEGHDADNHSSHSDKDAELGEHDMGEGVSEDGGLEAGAGDDEGSSQDGSQAVSRFVQTMVFSATLTLPEKLRKRLSRGSGGATGSGSFQSLIDRLSFRGKPKVADLTKSQGLPDKVQEAVLYCSEAERDVLLYYLLAVHVGRTLVFVNAISAVRRLAAVLRMLGLPASPLHSSMQQRQRLKALDRFRTNPDAILVATDVAARGLDIQGVRCVVHYQVAASADTYVHRTGRTARAEEDGLAVSLVSPKDAPRFSALMKVLGREEPQEFPVQATLLPAAQRRVRLALRLDQLQRAESKPRTEQNWRRHTAKSLGLDDEDELLGSDSEEADGDGFHGQQSGKGRKGHNAKHDSSIGKEVVALQRELAGMLVEPLQPLYSRKFFAGRPSAAATLEGGRKAGPSLGASRRASNGDTVKSDSDHRTATGVAKTVALAQSLMGARQSGKPARSAGVAAKRTVTKPWLSQRRAATDEEILKEIMRKRTMKRSGKKRMVVIGPVFTRGQTGADALTALRSSTSVLT
eukprot:jgi/Botrbrau1/13094/Bobra.0187s0053.1